MACLALHLAEQFRAHGGRHDAFYKLKPQWPSLVTADVIRKKLNAKSKLAAFKRQLVPWIRARGTSNEFELPPELLAELTAIIHENPNHEPALRELFRLQALTSDRTGALDTIKRIIALPGKQNTRQQIADRNTLANLQSKQPPTDPIFEQTGLSRAQLIDLGHFILTEGESATVAELRTLDLTRRWLAEVQGLDQTKVDEAIERLDQANLLSDWRISQDVLELTAN